jgi:hypothetical protein
MRRMSLQDAVTKAVQESDELSGQTVGMAIEALIKRMRNPGDTPEGAQSIAPPTDSQPATADVAHQVHVQEVSAVFSDGGAT